MKDTLPSHKPVSLVKIVPRFSHGGTKRIWGAKNPARPEPMQGTKAAGRPDFDISPPEKWPQWLLNADTENATVEVLADGTVIWWGGSFHDGIWTGPGYFMGGRWRDGIFLDGVMVQCLWSTGEKRGGEFLDVTWLDGVHRDGKFSGWWRGGQWLGGEWNGYWRRDADPPPVLPPFNKYEPGR